MSQQRPTGSAPSAALEQAEGLRRSDRAEAALARAEEALAAAPDDTALRLASALALLDLGRLQEARETLERALPRTSISDPAGVQTGIDDTELESAFASATTDPDQMLSADHVAEAAIRAIEGDQPEGIQGNVLTDEAFQTPTMANLLESQGHADEAERMREALSERRSTDSTPLIPTLERWLVNLRRAHR